MGWYYKKKKDHWWSSRSLSQMYSNNNNLTHKLETLGRSLMTGGKQHNYKFIARQSGKLAETWAGIRDTFHKSDIIRIDAGLRSGKPHINIDPRGYPCKGNPHISLPTGVATMAYYGQRAFTTMSSAMSIWIIGLDSYRMAKAFNADYQNTMSPGNFNLLPKNTMRTGASIAGTYVGGYGGGYVGSIIGGFIGGSITGMTGDPSVVVVGTFLGAVTGAMVGSVIAGSYCSIIAREKVEQWIDIE